MLGLAGITVVGGAAVGPAGPATAQLVPGELAIAAPVSVALADTTAGGTTTAALGSVTVDDDRPVPGPTWTATVSATAFTTGSGTPIETIPPSALTYTSGPAIATSGPGTFVPGQPTAAEAVALGTTVEAFRVEGATARTTATWSPVLLVTVPSGKAVGTYSGTLTHSVA